MSADIKPLGAWTAPAVAADCVNRVKDGDALLCIWLGEDGDLHWAKTDMSPARYATFAAMAQTMATDAMRVILLGDDDSEEAR